jgi:cytochrome c
MGMDSFEWNKVAMAVLVAGVTAMSISMVVGSFYAGAEKHDAHAAHAKRGYQIEVTEEAPADAGDAAPKSADIAAFFANASAEKGENLAKACAACHSFDKGGTNKVGPNLYGIVGAKTAHKNDYSYSNALAALNKTWDYQSLSEFIEKPRVYVSGTKMAFAGMKKPEDRASLLLYLRSLSDAPVPLPEVKAAPQEDAPAKNAAPEKNAVKEDAAVSEKEKASPVGQEKKS